LANLIAGFLIFKMRRNPTLGSIIGAIVVGLMVGGYLWLFLPTPSLFGIEVLYPWLVSVMSIMVSSLITMVLLGGMLLKALSKPSIVKFLEARGLRTYMKKK